MADFPTRTDLFRVGKNAVLAATGNQIPEKVIDTEGSDINILLGAFSHVANEVVRSSELAFRALFLDTASSEELDLLAFDHYGILRKPASPATGQVTFSRPGPGAAGSVPVGFRVQAVKIISAAQPGDVSVASGQPVTVVGPTYQTTQAAVFAGGTTTVTVAVESLTAARGQGSDVGIVTILLDAPFDTDIVVTNADVIAGGADAENDEDFRERVRRFWQVAERGTLAALEFGALTVAGVAKSTAVEDIDPFGDPARTVRLYISDQDGVASAVMVAAVKATLKGDSSQTDTLKRGFRAAGINVAVIGGTPILTAIIYKLQFAAGVDTLVASGQVRNATIAHVNRLSPGQSLLVSDLFAVAASISGVIVPSDAVVAPVGDLIPQPGQVIRTDEGSVTFQ